MKYPIIRRIVENHLNGAIIMSIDTATEVKLNKFIRFEDGSKMENPHHGRVIKCMYGAQVMVFQNKKEHGYSNKVRRELEKEGKDPESFQLSPRKWGEREEGTPFVHHGEKHYLEVIFLEPGEVEYLLDGEPIDKDDIDGMPPQKTEAHQGGLENKVILRTFETENIAAIRVGGQEHVVED